MHPAKSRLSWFAMGLSLLLSGFSCSDKSTDSDKVGDVTPPTVSVTYPANGSEVSGTVIVTAEASDNVGVTKVGFYTDGQLRYTDTSTPWRYSWNCDGYTGGSQHTVYAKAYDAIGNSSSSSVVQVTVDAQQQNRPPSSPSNPTPTSNSCGIPRGAYLTWSASDPDGDPLTYDVYFGTSSNPSLRQSSLTTNSCKITDIYSVSYDIEYYWKIVVKDDHEHQAVGTIWHFTTEAADDVPYYYYIEDIWWSDEIDNNSDDYTSYRKLHFDVNVSCGTHNVYTEIWERHTGSDITWRYLTTSHFTVSGTSTNDAYSVDVGLPNNELSRGIYDFEIRIYESGNDSVVATDGIAYAAFETSSQDANSATYWIRDTWWTGFGDEDLDGYSRSKRLHFDVDVNSGTHSLYADVSYRASSSTDFKHYYTTSDFWVAGNGNQSDICSLTVGSPNLELSHDSYDFRIAVLESGTYSPELTAIGPSDDVLLDDERFETSSEDEPIETYWLFMEWVYPYDNDGDGYTSFRNLLIKLHVNVDSASVYAKVYYKRFNVSSYSLYYETPDFIISSDGKNYVVWIGEPNMELSHGVYDFRIEIFKTGTNSIVASLGPSDDGNLDDEKFETAAED